MKLSIAVILFLILNGCLNKQHRGEGLIINHGTTILTFISPDSICIAADSKVSPSLDNISFNSFSKQKIINVNKIVFGVDGSSLIQSASTGEIMLDPYKTMGRIIQDENDYYKSLDRFTDTILKDLKVLIALCKKEKTVTSLYKFFASPIFEIVMASYIKGKPVSHLRSFHFRAVGINLVPEIFQTLTYDGTGSLLRMGVFDHIDSLLEQQPSYFNYGSIKDKLVCLINLEAQKDSLYVGMPADVFVLKPDTILQYNKIKKCPIEN